MIRRATEKDAAAVRAIYAPYIERTSVTFEETVPPVAEFAKRIREYGSFAPWLVEEEEGRVRGYAYACKHRERAAYRWSVETSVYVAENARRAGIGRGLYEALLARLRAQGFCNAYAGITLPNPASVSFHESLGFQPVGVYRKIGFKREEWHDVGWWQLALQPEHPATPREPSAPV
jgi:phosphinothricin acetyltransferase